MKLISWNVNGLRALMGKGFLEIFEALDADIFCLQETKLQPDQIDLSLPGYELLWNSADKNGILRYRHIHKTHSPFRALRFWGGCPLP